MQQALKTSSFLKSLFGARQHARRTPALQVLERDALRRVAGGSSQPDPAPKGGW